MESQDTKFCVYAHRRLDTREIFYIGEGTKRRPKAACKYTRGKRWLQVVQDAGGFTIEILEDNLSKQEAQDLEKKYIDTHRDILINSDKNTQPTDMILSDFIDSFEYDESSPTGLIWKTGRSKGKPAGRVHNNNGKQYWKLCFKNRTFRVHRVIMLLVTGEIDKSKVVDHIDGNGLNNNISNLRICTQLENMQNIVSTRHTSDVGVVGVKYSERNNSFIANLTMNGIYYSKSFSCLKYGHEIALEMAINYRKSLEEKRSP